MSVSEPFGLPCGAGRHAAPPVRGLLGEACSTGSATTTLTLFFLSIIVLIVLAGAVRAAAGAVSILPKSSMAYRLKPPGFRNFILSALTNWGRDMLSRLLWGGRTSLLMGIVAGLSCYARGRDTGRTCGLYRRTRLIP